MSDTDKLAKAVAATHGLTGVPHTLTLTLRCRHTASLRQGGFISDDTATELCTTLGLKPLSDPPSTTEMCIAVRTELFDDAVSEFAKENSNGVVVTLGAGLCTRFERLKTLDLDWIDVDFPEVAQIRNSLLPPGDRRTVIPNSVFEHHWRDRVGESTAGSPKLFILEGLLVYFTEEQVRELLGDLAKRFPGAEFLVEAMGSISARTQPKAVRSSGARFSWGVDDFATISTWIPSLKLLDTWYLIDYHRELWSRFFRVVRISRFARAQMKIGRFVAIGA